MSIVTNAEVFEFIGADASVQTKQADNFTNLIVRQQANIENIIGRKVESTIFADVLFSPNINCRIYLPNPNTLFLTGIYRDIFEITSISETGQTLEESTDYNDGKDYILDKQKGVLIRINNFWDRQQLSIKISGKLGLVDVLENPLQDIKQILIEMVAAKSGLWKNNVETEDGTISTSRTKISKDTKKMLKLYKLRDF